jgi:hypothetical protein
LLAGRAFADDGAMTTRGAGLLAMIVMAGCTSTEPKPSAEASKSPVGEPSKAPVGEPSKAPADPPTAEPPTQKPEAPAPVPADDPRWTCATDEDCVQTCALGAVASTWLQRNRNLDTCDDGCYWKNDSVACRDGSCVTLTADGTIDAACSHVTNPRH